MSKFLCFECSRGIHRHSLPCKLEWTDSVCKCELPNIIFCTICKQRPATVMQSEYMRQYATPDRMQENWVYRIVHNIPELCQPCENRLWSS